MVKCRKTVIRASPIPQEPTRAISTASLRRLKYWPTIKVAVSLIRPTPIPV